MTISTQPPVYDPQDQENFVEFLISQRAEDLGIQIAGRGDGDEGSVAGPMKEFRSVVNRLHAAFPAAVASAGRLCRSGTIASRRGAASGSAESASLVAFAAAEGVSLWMTGASHIDGWDPVIPIGAAVIAGGITLVTHHAGGAYGRYKGLEARFQDKVEQNDPTGSKAAAREVGVAYNHALGFGVGAVIANLVTLAARAIGLGSGSPAIALLVSVLALGLGVVVVLTGIQKVRNSFVDEDKANVRLYWDLLGNLHTDCPEGFRARRRVLLTNRLGVIDDVLGKWALVKTSEAAAARETIQTVRANTEKRIHDLGTRGLPSYKSPSLDDIANGNVPEPPDPTDW